MEARLAFLLHCGKAAELSLSSLGELS